MWGKVFPEHKMQILAVSSLYEASIQVICWKRFAHILISNIHVSRRILLPDCYLWCAHILLWTKTLTFMIMTFIIPGVWPGVFVSSYAPGEDGCCLLQWRVSTHQWTTQEGKINTHTPILDFYPIQTLLNVLYSSYSDCRLLGPIAYNLNVWKNWGARLSIEISPWGTKGGADAWFGRVYHSGGITFTLVLLGWIFSESSSKVFVSHPISKIYTF